MDLMNAQEDPNRKAMLSLMAQRQPEGQPGAELPVPGIVAGEDKPNMQPAPIVDATPKPDAPMSPEGPAAPAYNFGRAMGLDEGKFNDPNKHDFKYDTMRTMSQFDPRQGFTPEVIDALNKLDYGTFSGSGDKLSLSGAKNAKDAADFANQDWIYAHDANSDATKWNFGGGGADGGGGGDVPNGTVPGTGGDITAPQMMPSLNAGVPTDNGFFEKLLEQARGIAGPAATDRKALLSLMK